MKLLRKLLLARDHARPTREIEPALALDSIRRLDQVIADTDPDGTRRKGDQPYGPEREIGYRLRRGIQSQNRFASTTRYNRSGVIGSRARNQQIDVFGCTCRF
jgi:hypothetical protein